MVAQPAPKPVEFTLNGTAVIGRADESLIDAAKRHGIEVPHLCYKEGMRPDGNCRACMVEIKGERVLAPVVLPLSHGRHGGHHRQRARGRPARRWCSSCCSRTCPRRPTRSIPSSIAGRGGSRSASPVSQPGISRSQDVSHPAIAVNLDACIQCGRCVRACREEQVNDVIGYAFRGSHSKIVFDLDDPMGDSTCVACGECVQACPTGALMPAREVGKIVADKQVESVCPYCGVGCQLTYHIKDNAILFVQGKDGPANSSRLCVKGRYGFDYVQHKHRLTTPLIRKPGAIKHKDFTVDPDNWSDVFREASWEEALDFAAERLARRSGTRTARSRWPASARRRAPTKRPTCSRSSCAPASARTTSITARGCATPRASPR